MWLLAWSLCCKTCLTYIGDVWKDKVKDESTDEPCGGHDGNQEHEERLPMVLEILVAQADAGKHKLNTQSNLKAEMDQSQGVASADK